MDEWFPWWLPSSDRNRNEKTTPIANFLRRGSFDIAETAVGSGLAYLGYMFALNPSTEALNNSAFSLVFVGGGLACVVSIIDGLRRTLYSPLQLIGEVRDNRKAAFGGRRG